MDDVERQLAKQMADVLRTRIKEFEALKETSSTAPAWVGAKLALLRDLLAELERQLSSNSHVVFRDWNGWIARYPQPDLHRRGLIDG